MTIAEKFAHFTVKLRYEELPEEVRRQACLFFLDWLGSAIRGAEEEPTKIILATILEMKGEPESTVLADGSKNSCLLAALANGASSHVMEMDDLHRPGIFHPAAPIFPAVLAVGEKMGVTGKGLIEAVIAGYEIGIRTAVAVGKTHYQYWHNTGTCGTFGAAAATAKLLKLNAQQTAWSLGTAGTQAAGLWEFSQGRRHE